LPCRAISPGGALVSYYAGTIDNSQIGSYIGSNGGWIQYQVTATDTRGNRRHVRLDLGIVGRFAAGGGPEPD